MRQGEDTGSRRANETKATEEAQEEHQSFNTLVGESIRRVRQERGWTQAVLADEARLSSNYVARLERGELGPSLFVANRICSALAIPLNALVGFASANATRKTGKRRVG